MGRSAFFVGIRAAEAQRIGHPPVYSPCLSWTVTVDFDEFGGGADGGWLLGEARSGGEDEERVREKETGARFENRMARARISGFFGAAV
jgi:hypothetical protein